MYENNLFWAIISLNSHDPDGLSIDIGRRYLVLIIISSVSGTSPFSE